jgi:hypothetical protein
LQRFVDFGVGGGDFHPFQFERGKVDLADVGQQFDRNVVFQIVALFIRLNLDLGLAGGPQTALVEQLLGAVAQGRFQDFAAHRRAEPLLENTDRRLAGTKTGDASVLTDLAQTAVDSRLYISGGDGDFEIFEQTL